MVSHEPDIGAPSSVAAGLGPLAGILFILAIFVVFGGLISGYAEQHNSTQACEERAATAPADFVPNGESLSNGSSISTWPLGVTCHYLMADGSTYFQQPSWTLTATVWGGAGIGILSLIGLAGTAVASAVDLTRSTRR